MWKSNRSLWWWLKWNCFFFVLLNLCDGSVHSECLSLSFSACCVRPSCCNNGKYWWSKNEPDKSQNQLSVLAVQWWTVQIPAMLGTNTCLILNPHFDFVMVADHSVCSCVTYHGKGCCQVSYFGPRGMVKLKVNQMMAQFKYFKT